MKICRKMWE